VATVCGQPLEELLQGAELVLAYARLYRPSSQAIRPCRSCFLTLC